MFNDDTRVLYAIQNLVRLTFRGLFIANLMMATMGHTIICFSKFNSDDENPSLIGSVWPQQREILMSTGLMRIPVFGKFYRIKLNELSLPIYGKCHDGDDR